MPEPATPILDESLANKLHQPRTRSDQAGGRYIAGPDVDAMHVMSADHATLLNPRAQGNQSFAAPAGPTLLEVGPKLMQFYPTSISMSPNRVDAVQMWAISADPGPNFTEAGAKLPDTGRVWSNIGEARPNMPAGIVPAMVETWPILGLMSDLGRCYPIRPNAAQLRPPLTGFNLVSTNICRYSANFARSRRHLELIREISPCIPRMCTIKPQSQVCRVAPCKLHRFSSNSTPRMAVFSKEQTFPAWIRASVRAIRTARRG